MQIDLSIKGVSVGIVGPTRNNRVDVAVRTGIILVVHTTSCTVVPIVSITRINLNSPVVIGYGLLKLALPDTRNGPKIVDIFDIGIQRDSLTCIFFGPYIIVQIILGDGAVLPWLVKVGPKRDDLVEILHGKHVVLVVEGYLSACHQPINIELRTGNQRDKGEENKCNLSFHATMVINSDVILLAFSRRKESVFISE